MTAMARPSKGTRKTIRLSTLSPAVRTELVNRAHNASVPLSGYLADHLALHVGRPDLVRHLGQGELLKGRLPEHQAAHPATISTLIRVDETVHRELHSRALTDGIALATYVTRWCERHARNGTDATLRGVQEVLAVTA